MIIWIFCLFFLCQTGQAAALSVSTSPLQQVISETMPTAFAPADFTVDDFLLEWSSPPLPGVTVSWISESLQWVRVDDYFVFPRGQIAVTVQNADGGDVTISGVNHPLSFRGNVGQTSALVAMVSGPSNIIKIKFVRGNQITEGALMVRFQPRRSLSEGHMFFDTSCSREPISLSKNKLKADQWMYVSCRRITIEAPGHHSSELEVLVYWDNVNEPVKINGVSAPPLTAGIWSVHATFQNESLLFDAGQSEVEFQTKVPEVAHLASFALGEGPYLSNFQSSDTNFSGIVPVTTLYGSYIVGSSARMIFFGAVTASPQIYSDLGGYIEFESYRALDRRLSLNLLLGAHGLGFQADGVYYVNMGAPQGFEFVLSDVFKKSFNFSGGGFVQPNVNGASYYNVWLRWGSPSYFLEANYIYWTEQTSSSFLARNVGVTVGMPLLGFW